MKVCYQTNGLRTDAACPGVRNMMDFCLMVTKSFRVGTCWSWVSQYNGMVQRGLQMISSATVAGHSSLAPGEEALVIVQGGGLAEASLADKLVCCLSLLHF